MTEHVLIIRRKFPPSLFPELDTLTGTSEADTFELEPPGFGTQSLDDDFIPVDIDYANNLIALGIPTIVDLSEDSEVDLLVYQEQERATYLERFQAPTARSYTYIEDFDLIEDEIIVGGNPYRIEIDDEIIAGESSDDDLFVLKNPWRDHPGFDVADLIITDFRLSDNDRIIIAGKHLG